MTEREIPKILSAVLDVHPDMAGTEDLQQFKQELASRIENRDLRQYNIHFRSGSLRVIEPIKPHQLVLDFDRENGKLRSLFRGISGETETIFGVIDFVFFGMAADRTTNIE